MTALTHIRLKPDTLAMIDWLATAAPGPGGKPGCRTRAIVTAISDHVRCLLRAITVNSQLFTAAEWGFLAEATGKRTALECRLAWLTAADIANFVDSTHALSRLGDKWFAAGNTVNRSTVDRKVTELRNKIAFLEPIAVAAVLFVVWRHLLNKETAGSQWWDVDCCITTGD